MTKLQIMKCCIASLVVAAFAHAQSTTPQVAAGAVSVRSKTPATSEVLKAFDDSLETVVSRVAPAVVQIVVAGYGPSEDHGHTTARIVRQHAIGAGIIVDPDGYIMTNAHVVEGAERIRIILPPPADSTIEVPPIQAGQILDATLLG